MFLGNRPDCLSHSNKFRHYPLEFNQFHYFICCKLPYAVLMKALDNNSKPLKDTLEQILLFTNAIEEWHYSFEQMDRIKY